MTRHLVDRSYNFHNLVTLRIRRTRQRVYDAFGMDMLDRPYEHYRVSSPTESPDVLVEVGPFVRNLSHCFRVDRRYFVRRDFIAFSGSYKGGRWFCEIDGLESGRIRARIQSNILGHLAYGTIAPKGVLILALIRRGIVPIHAGAVAFPNGDGVLFPARSGVGKTITAVSFTQQGFRLLGDDYSLMKDKVLYSYAVPFNLRFTYDPEELHGKKFPAAVRRELFLKRMISLMTLRHVNLLTKLPIRYVFPDCLQDRAPLRRLYLLNHGTHFDVERQVPKCEVIRAMEANMWFELDELRKLVYAYASCFPDSWLSDFWRRIRTLIADNIADVTCHRIRVPTTYSDEIVKRVVSEVKEHNPDGCKIP